jgi:ELWxxDGT repeat protein
MDIYTGLNPSFIGNFTPYNSNLLFSAFDPINGQALCETDGTIGGTVMIKDFDPSTQSAAFLFSRTSLTASFFNFQNKLYFTANNGTMALR